MGTEEKTLESRLEELLEQETFSPPDEFREQANISDESIYDEADKDYEGFWEQQAEALDWEQKWDQVLDWSDPPNAKWFVGGKLNVAYNCVDRHVEAGHGEQVAFHWEGEPGDTRTITYAELQREVCRAATHSQRALPGVVRQEEEAGPHRRKGTGGANARRYPTAAG